MQVTHGNTNEITQSYSNKSRTKKLNIHIHNWQRQKILQTLTLTHTHIEDKNILARKSIGNKAKYKHLVGNTWREKERSTSKGIFKENFNNLNIRHQYNRECNQEKKKEGSWKTICIWIILVNEIQIQNQSRNWWSVQIPWESQIQNSKQGWSKAQYTRKLFQCLALEVRLRYLTYPEKKSDTLYRLQVLLINREKVRNVLQNTKVKKYPG